MIDQISAQAYRSDDSQSKVDFYLLGDAANVVLENMGKTGAFSFLVADQNPIALNPVAAGSTITATATTGLAVTVVAPTVPSTQSPSASAISYSFDDTTTTGVVTITVRSPGGLSVAFSQRLYLGAAPAAFSCP